MIAGDDNGALPVGWEHVVLGDVATLSADKVDPRETPEAPYLGLEHVEAQTMRILGRGQGADVRSTKSAFRAGDVLYGKLRPYLNKVARPDFDGICSTDFLVFGDSPAIDAAFLARFLSQPLVVAFAHSASNGVELPRVAWKALRALPMALPPVAEQRRIADRLGEIESRCAGTAAHIRSARAIIERFRGAVLASACSGRLTADWREANPRDGVVPGPPPSNRAAAHVSGAPNTDQLTVIPETWAWWTIEAITDRVIDYRGRTPPVDADGTIPHVRTTQIRNGRIDWNVDRFVTSEVYDEYMTRGLPRRGDVLFTMEAPMGEVGVIDRDEQFSIAQRILLLRPGFGVTGTFLSLALQSAHVRRAMGYRTTGTGVSGIAYKRLRSVVLPRPPEDEQDEIVRRVDVMLVAADHLIAQTENAAAALDRASRASLSKAFRGELVPTEAAVAEDEARDYESAEELLSRVNAQATTERRRPRSSGRDGAKQRS